MICVDSKSFRPSMAGRSAPTSGEGFSCAACWFWAPKLLVSSGTLSGAFGLVSTNLKGAGGFSGAFFGMANSSGASSMSNCRAGGARPIVCAGSMRSRCGISRKRSRCTRIVPSRPICTERTSGSEENRGVGRRRRGLATGGVISWVMEGWTRMIQPSRPACVKICFVASSGSPIIFENDPVRPATSISPCSWMPYPPALSRVCTFER